MATDLRQTQGTRTAVEPVVLPMPPRGTRAALVLALVAASCANAAATTGDQATPTDTPARQPDIVLILTDDQRWDTLWAMPTVRRLLVDRGVLFRRGYVVNPVCCPSRATFLTGDYSHTTKVYTNRSRRPYGGFPAFDDSSTIATWLQRAGYRTGLFGKYLNGYPDRYVPPGWDRWFATYDNQGAYYDYHATSDGRLMSFGDDPADYGTTVLTRRAVSFIEGTAADRPLFLYWAVHAPHESATPAPGDRRAFAELPPWRPSSYDEANVADKPAWVEKRPLDSEKARSLDAFRLDQYRSLMAVDRGVGELVHALRESGRLANTLIVFASDNGYMWGEHRLKGKSNPYEEAIRVPFVIRYDRLLDRARTDRTHLVLNLDVAPTFADAAGVQTPGTEGRSLLPLLAQPSAGWRNAFLIEHLSIGRHGAPTFCAVHTQRFILVRYRTGEREMYDLRRDRLELRNVASRPGYHAARRRLLARLRSLCDPAPPGFSFG